MLNLLGQSLRLESVSKHYGSVQAVRDVSLTLEPGETLALLGPSGCGKSTLLRLIAGLEAADTGRVLLGERDITRLAPQKRGFGLVFQDYALFPHLNVERNVAYGLVEKGWPRERQRARVAELLALVGLEGYGKRRTFELSGGEQQRVALARALAPEPRLLLLDEPLSNLDLALREDLKGQLKQLLAGLDISAVYVTHDQSEAFALADCIAVMRSGRLVQAAQAAELFAAPATAWVARFLGHSNLFAREEVAGLAAETNAPYVLVRADLVMLGQGAYHARVTAHEVTGATHNLELKLEQPAITLRWQGFSRDLPYALRAGDTVTLHIPPAAVCGLEADL